MAVKAYNLFGTPYDYPRDLINGIEELRRADHVAFNRWRKWTYAIVENINLAEETVDLIRFKNGFIRQMTIPYNKEVWYRMRHDKQKCRTPDEVIKQAKSLLNHGYENFTLYCKLNTENETVREELEVEMEGKYTGTAKMLKMAGVPGAVGEIGLAAQDIKKARRQKESGLLEEQIADDAVATRATVATGQVGGAATGAVTGAAIGAVVTGPLAPVGAVVGGLIGGVAGLAAGTGVGVGVAKAVVRVKHKFHGEPQANWKSGEYPSVDQEGEKELPDVVPDNSRKESDSGEKTPESPGGPLKPVKPERLKKKAAANKAGKANESNDGKVTGGDGGKATENNIENTAGKGEQKAGLKPDAGGGGKNGGTQRGSLQRTDSAVARDVIAEGNVARDKFIKKTAAERARMEERLQVKLLQRKAGRSPLLQRRADTEEGEEQQIDSEDDLLEEKDEEGCVEGGDDELYKTVESIKVED